MSDTNSNIIAHVKKRAKKLHKQNPEKTHVQWLEECSKNLGYRDYHDLMQQANSLQHTDSFSQSAASSICLLDRDSEIINLLLEECVVSEQKGVLINKFWNLLLYPIDKESPLEDVEQLTRQKIDKETLKEYGYSFLERTEPQLKDFGYLLLAMSHYFRSLMDNCRYQIAEHPKFTDYFGLWLRRHQNSNNERDESPTLEKLKQFYTFNENEELFKGSTSWAPKWWLEEQGRI